MLKGLGFEGFRTRGPGLFDFGVSGLSNLKHLNPKP